MRKQHKLLVGLSAILFASSLFARVHEFRSPLTVRRGPMRFPLKHVTDAWWFEDMPMERPEKAKWCDFEFWSAGFARFGCESYFDCEGGNTTDRASLSTLFFGKEGFRGEEIFVGGMIDDPRALTDKNVFLGSACITPRFDYNEYGVMWGIETEKYFGKDDKWHAGMRITLPFKVIEIEHSTGCRLEETLDDMVCRIPTSFTADADPGQIDYAYRLDLLSTLVFPREADGVTPVVSYADGTNNTTMPSLTADTFVGSQNVTSNTKCDPAENGGTEPADNNVVFPPIYLIRSDGAAGDCDVGCECPCPTKSNIKVTGECPCPPFAKSCAQVSGPLGADGSGGGDQAVLFFKRGNNYADNLGKDRDAQGTLFVVPRVDSTDPFNIAGRAGAIGQAIDRVLEFITTQEGVVEYFRVQGIDLWAHECDSALGDLDFDWYVGYGHRYDWFADFLFGVRFPTGTKIKDAKRVYQVPTGNNRHFEITVGAEGGWRPCHWFAFDLHAAFHHAFKRSEKRAAAFEGATVRNIGPEVDADVSWNYGVVRANLNFFHPWHEGLGWVFGYELMAKGKDDVDFDCDCEAPKDFFGRTGALNSCLLEDNTNTMTHKLRGEIFHRWNYFELFSGASHVVAGKHAMRETEWHIGFNVYF